MSATFDLTLFLCILGLSLLPQDLADVAIDLRATSDFFLRFSFPSTIVSVHMLSSLFALPSCE